MTKNSTVKIYLAPANHYNAYCIAGYNEKTQCEQLARLVQERLSAYDGTAVYHTTVYADSRDYKGRPEEAAALGADYYIALHDNAYQGRHSGAQTFYHPDSTRSKALAAAIAEKLNAVCTVPVTFPNPVRSGMDAFDGAGYGEIREPYKRGVIPVIVEVNFHDYEPAARYLIDHQDEQADAIVRAIAETLGLKKNTTPAPTPDAKPFPDVPASAWYAEAVNELAARGIVNGYPDGSFKPEQTATRAEVAVMLYRALKSFAQNANDNK